MFGSLKGRVALILLVMAGSAWALYDNYSTCTEQRQENDSPRPCSPVKLGLDLQGGMHLVLEVDDPQGTMTAEAKADATERALKIIRTRIDEFGVEEPLIQRSGDDRIIVELAGITDEERAKEILRQTAFLQFYLVHSGREYQDFMEALPRLDRAVIAAFGEEAAAQVAEQGPSDRETVEQLLFGGESPADTGGAAADTAGAAADTAGAAADTALGGQAGGEPEEPSARPFSALLMESGQPGRLLVQEQDVELMDRWLSDPRVQRAVPRGVSLHWGQEPEGQGAELYRSLWVLEDPAFLGGEDLEDAQPGRDPQFNETIVSFNLTRSGGRTFERVTGANIRELIAIVLDGEVVSAPVIQSQIGARGQIQLGAAPLAEAQDLALVLRAGALPAPLRILEERTIGPSLGADSVNEGKIAGIVGLVLVILITISYYRIAGVLAVGALMVYTLLTLGGLAAVNAALTAPGIAGLILSIGMAIDANVLEFERIREELALGRTVRTAVDKGFENALSAIVDSNLTTLITAVVLFQFGTGPVRGFAVTLSIGIIASFFSAVFVTRTFFLLYLERKPRAQTLSI